MKLSIITINYNKKVGLEKTAQSVIAQTFRDFEWIVVDGGSTDGSVDVIKKIASQLTTKTSKLLSYWCSEKDNGIYNAMNKGIAHSKGEYLLFLNSGDYLAENSVLSNVFSSNFDEELLFGYIYRIKKGKLYLDKGFDTADITIRHLLRNSLPHQATFIKRALFDKYGMYDETLKVVADWKFFMICIILHDCTIRNLQIPITVYEAGGISDDPSSGGTEEWNKTLAELLPNRVINDFHFLRSCEDVCSIPIGRFFYRILYRLVMFIKY